MRANLSHPSRPASVTTGNGSFPRLKQPGSVLFRANFTFTFYVLDPKAGV